MNRNLKKYIGDHYAIVLALLIMWFILSFISPDYRYFEQTGWPMFLGYVTCVALHWKKFKH